MVDKGFMDCPVACGLCPGVRVYRGKLEEKKKN